MYIFSDVVCTWSWGEEKVLRALDYLYGENIEFENIMGGMISDYHDILPMNMKDQDSDDIANGILKQIWNAGSTVHKMPVSEELPNLLSKTNPSTNKLDKFFVAARKIDVKKSNVFLRLLREATILDKINTMNLDNIYPLLKKAGIDEKNFLEVFEMESDQLFLEDRMSTFDRRLETFPNFMYVNEKGREFILKGFKSKNELINFIEKHSNLKPREINLSNDEVLNFIKIYKRVFKAELIELFEDEVFVENSIEYLLNNNKIKVDKEEITLI